MICIEYKGDTRVIDEGPVVPDKAKPLGSADDAIKAEQSMPHARWHRSVQGLGGANFIKWNLDSGEPLSIGLNGLLIIAIKIAAV